MSYSDSEKNEKSTMDYLEELYSSLRVISGDTNFLKYTITDSRDTLSDLKQDFDNSDPKKIQDFINEVLEKITASNMRI